ncbi:MAG: RNA-binding protein [Desulfobulbaceae bacterium]|nr:RNA-binding protein [Desulfobulbaceae bacterium]MCK5323024.1 RNA-binding protein [Desulfobulbaceae bacterium]MCK5436555.1 RNA-binding protein [Desulfobulbaceae bacterium]MCK5544087.1 RNA-binding protein [Desulfobulbaceae bacterium]
MAEGNKVRIDKWLWAARFFKTRSQAAHAVSGGKVHVNGVRIKPACIVNRGDELCIRRGEYEFVVIVQGLSGKRGPAVQAQTLYEETEESIMARESLREQRRMLAAEQSGPVRRPTKRDRRLIRNFIRKER